MSMAKKNQHVITHGGEWAIKGEGNKKATKETKTKKGGREDSKRDCKEKQKRTLYS
jgi:hypothetical protein